MIKEYDLKKSLAMPGSTNISRKSILGDVQFLFWIIYYRTGMVSYPSGIQGLGWESIFSDPLHILAMFILFLNPVLAMSIHSFIVYFMKINQQYHPSYQALSLYSVKKWQTTTHYCIPMNNFH